MNSNFKTVDWGDPGEESSKAKLLAGDFPEKWNQRGNLKLPTASELAQIAACLPPEFNERERIEKALDLYFDSDEVLTEIRERTEEDPADLLMDYRPNEAVARDLEMWDESNSIHLKTWVEDYTECPARMFFKENGYDIKTPNTVIKNILEHGGQGAEFLIERAKRETSEGTLYAFPKKLLERVVAVRKKKKSASVSKGHKARQEKKSVKKKPPRQEKKSGKKKATRSRSKQK
jgi:hypothetical protein